MTTGAVAQLSRLLALIPWLLARPGVGVDDAAREFGVTPTQLRKDLELAFLCGLPGHLPDDLIDVSLDGDTILVSNADTIARPMRLGADEALALLVGLRTLAAVPGGHDRAALESTLAKLQSAAGDAADAAERIAVQVEGDAAASEQLRLALEHGHRVHLRYYVPARDEVTDRDVDPLRLVVLGGRTYLEGWCHSAEAVRTFRLDRVAEVTELDVPAQVPPGAERPELDDDVFAPAEDQMLATVEVTAAGRWLIEAYPVESVSEQPGGSAVVTLRVGDTGWLRRLALRMGGACHVLDPPELAAAVRDQAQEALAGYS
ncbi:MAG: WYL domain-containing protein [Actinomycetes bacterium]